MSEDFCITHGYEHMKRQFGNPIAYCQACEDEREQGLPHGAIMDEMDHQAKYQPATIDTRREQELRIQALGAAISRRDWHAAERAYDAIRDKFYEQR